MATVLTPAVLLPQVLKPPVTQAPVTARSTLLNGLLAYWKLDETGGNRADSLGTHTLTDNNTVTYATGKLGNAASFASANSEYLSVADHADFCLTGDRTFAGWVWFVNNDLRCVLSRWGGTGEYILDCMPGTNIRWIVSSCETLVSTDKPTNQTWNFLLASYEHATKTLRLQRNNGTESSKVGAAVAAVSNNDFCLGYQPAVGRYMGGYMDEWGVWNRLLTTAEKAALYNAGSGLSYPF